MPKPMYVWSGSAWVSVATEVESLAGYATQSYADNTPGLRMVVPTSVAVGSGTASVDTVGTVTFSGASSVSLNGCFTSTYDNYFITLDDLVKDTSSGDLQIYLRLRVSGTDLSTGYYWGQHYSLWGSSTGGQGNLNNGSYFVAAGANSTIKSSSLIWLQNPFTTKMKGFQTLQTRQDASSYAGGYNSATTSYTGLSIVTASNLLSGTIRVYGYKD
jgi:hypothetical protein